ncbi:TetR/AcrR family transcriptional regulator [Lentilactobacillus kisonensis]|nr:TetR/AcrR family transcriptional regulator [Lentilactobacillus kisonensis]
MTGKTNDTKNEIIQATIRLISKNGYQQISLRNLLGSLKLTTGSFYKHFQNKEDLFRTVTKIVSAKLSNQAERTVITKNNNPLDALVALGGFMVQQFEFQPNLMDFLFFNEGIGDAYHSTGPTNFPLLDYTHQLVGEVASCYPISDSENDLFIKIWSFIQGYGILIRHKAVPYDEKLLRKAATELIGVN